MAADNPGAFFRVDPSILKNGGRRSAALSLRVIARLCKN